MASSSSPWRAFVHRYVIALGVALVLVMGGLRIGDQVISNKLNEIHRVKVSVADEGPAQAGNYLVVGSDSRAFVDNAAAEQAFGNPQVETGQRSDTLMVIHVDPAQQKSLLVSFPRDLRVNIPGRGRSKINAAFNDGPDKIIATLKDNFGIPIQHYVEVNFTAFQSIVDAIGKVPVYFDAAYRDQYSGLAIPGAGCVQLDGQQALDYVRARHLERYDPTRGRWVDASGRSDLDRIGRQQTFMRKLAALAASKSSSNPLTALDLADAIVPKLKVDGQLSRSDIFRLVNTFRKVDPNSSNALEMVTVPTEAISGSSDLQLAQPAAQQLLARLQTFGGSAPSASAVAKVHPADVKVRILNGSGQNGAAGRALASFQGYGFTPADVGNTTDTAATVIRYTAGNEAQAALVQQYLGGKGTLTVDPSVVGADVVVVLGSDFTGVAKPSGSAGSTSTTTAKAAKGKSAKAATPAAPSC